MDIITITILAMTTAALFAPGWGRARGLPAGSTTFWAILWAFFMSFLGILIYYIYLNFKYEKK